MSSLRDSIAPLESDLKAVPPRISVYHDLPFAIMRYDPADEWELRREIKLLATRLEAVGKEVHIILMSELLWSALEKVHQRDDDEGLEALIELEKARGYVEAQQQVTTYLSSKVWIPLWDLLAERLASISPENSVVFLTRVAAMSPGIFHMSMGVGQQVDTTDFHVEAIDLLSNHVSCEAGIALVVAINSALKRLPVQAGLVILGDLSIQGNIKPMRSLAEPLQVAMDNGARKALIPLENKRNFLEVSGDIVERVDPVFFSDPMTAAMKALGMT